MRNVINELRPDECHVAFFFCDERHGTKLALHGITVSNFEVNAKCI